LFVFYPTLLSDSSFLLQAQGYQATPLTPGSNAGMQGIISTAITCQLFLMVLAVSNILHEQSMHFVVVRLPKQYTDTQHFNSWQTASHMVCAVFFIFL
jgi:hypothetical protein